MSATEETDRRFEMSISAGMNQRYHQRKCGHWTRYDRGFRIAVGFFTTLGICLSATSAAVESLLLTSVSLGVAAIATIIAIVLNVFPFGEWAQTHDTLFARWTDFREDIDQVEFLKKSEQAGAIARLDAKFHRLCGHEPPPDLALLAQCFEEEEQSRKQAA